MSSPSAPTGTPAAAFVNSSNPAPVRSASQAVIAPEVAIPAARLYVPSYAPTVLHSDGDGCGWAATLTRNIVVPYMSMRSPGSLTPTLTASAQASMVPATTGTPAGRPVSAAPSPVTVPLTSAGQTRPR